MVMKDGMNAKKDGKVDESRFFVAVPVLAVSVVQVVEAVGAAVTYAVDVVGVHHHYDLH